jgi:hypothetical protein
MIEEIGKTEPKEAIFVKIWLGFLSSILQIGKILRKIVMRDTENAPWVDKGENRIKAFA